MSDVPFPVPRYGEAALADVMPSVLAALEAGGDNRLGLEPAARVVVVLVDGLGLVGLRQFADAAPFLSSMACSELTAGFPSTTVTSLASLSMGVPAGEHAMTGYTTYLDDLGEVINWLAWKPVGSGDDLRDQIVPETVQESPTMWRRAADAGVAVTIANARQFEDSGLTRAVFGGGRFDGAIANGDAIAMIGEAVERGHRSLVYGYLSELDLVGHVRGPGTDAWVAQLALVDRHLAVLADRLPPGTLLLVTADHGMVDMPAEQTIDADAAESPLRDGVLALAGEPRMRHVHARPGAAADLLATWRELLGDRAWVISRDDAIAAGLFGPVVTPIATARIGDVLAIARDGLGIVQRKRESRLSSLPGHHGGLTDGELLVPLLSMVR
ncbi:MAG TPA: alkaline phosphatase family protein [Mycobacteriales bacterium]|nr:alkaline phosphatase family protein [Mycobacteriales bacterium]